MFQWTVWDHNNVGGFSGFVDIDSFSKTSTKKTLFEIFK